MLIIPLAGCLLQKLLERPDGARQGSRQAMQVAAATAELLVLVNGSQKQSAVRLAAALGPALSGWMRACKEGNVDAGLIRVVVYTVPLYALCRN